jgi:hypothetical protein
MQNCYLLLLLFISLIIYLFYLLFIVAIFCSAGESNPVHIRRVLPLRPVHFGKEE